MIIEITKKAVKKQTASNFRYEGCSCHICPPCGWCTSHVYCDTCNELIYEDDIIEIDECFVCEACLVGIVGEEHE